MDAVSEASAQFQFIDKNGDGSLDLAELNEGLSDFGLTDAQIEAIFFELDVNKDGKVSQEEFLAGYASKVAELSIVNPDVTALDLRGVSVWHLKHVLLEEVRQTGGSEDSKIYEIEPTVIRAKGPNLICPRDGREGTAYVDAIGDEAAGRANFMLSYTWGYPVGSVVSSLTAYCKKNSLDPRTTFVWICCLCINQHRVKESQARGEVVPFDEFRAVFQSRVVGISHVLSLMAPWDAPDNLGRLWCLFEIFMALKLQAKQGSSCKLEIIMPPSEEASFSKALLWDFQKIAIAMARVDVENADASVAADKVAIGELVEREMGFSEVNKQVIGALRDWLAAAATAELEKLPKAKRGTSLLINNLAVLLKDQGKLAEAEPLYREAVEAQREVHGDRHPDTLISIDNLAALLSKQGKLADAEVLCREAVEAQREVLGDRHPSTLQSIGNLAVLLDNQGKLAEAEQLIREALEARREVLGDRHPSTLQSIGNLAALLVGQGKLADAEQLSREALEAKREVHGDRHQSTLASINNLAVLLSRQGKLAEAEPLSREALETKREVLGDRHPGTLTSIGNLALLLSNQGKLAEAEPLCREALEASREVLGDRHPDTLISISNLVGLLFEAGKLEEAQAALGDVVATAAEVLGERHMITMVISTKEARLRHAQPGGAAEGKEALRAAVELMAEVLGAEHHQTCKYKAILEAM